MNTRSEETRKNFSTEMGKLLAERTTKLFVFLYLFSCNLGSDSGRHNERLRRGHGTFYK